VVGESSGADGGDGFELLAASLRASSTDLSTFVRVLAEKLERALPGRVRVERRRTRFLSGERAVTRVECSLGERRYSLAVEGAQVVPLRSTAVRGIVLKSEPLSLDEWIDALAADLATEAQVSEQSRRAVQQLLEG
jgi:hypothetical protein